MNWDNIRFFLALHRHGTLTEAAASLAVNHATVSRRIESLEDSVGAPLFIKRPDGFVLTPFGESLLPAAHEVELAFSGVDRAVRSKDDSLSGDVRVATSQLLAYLLVLPASLELRTAHPGVIVDAIESTRFMDVSRLETDIAVRIELAREARGSSDLRVRYLAPLPWALFAPSGSPSCSDVVVYDDHAPGRVGEDWLAARPLYNIVMRTSSMYTTAAAIDSGMGAGFIPVALGRVLGLEQVTPPIQEAHVYLAIHPDLSSNARIRAVFDYLVEFAAQRPGLLG